MTSRERHPSPRPAGQVSHSNSNSLELDLDYSSSLLLHPQDLDLTSTQHRRLSHNTDRGLLLPVEEGEGGKRVIGLTDEDGEVNGNGKQEVTMTLPYLKLLPLLVARCSEGLNYAVIFPYINQM